MIDQLCIGETLLDSVKEIFETMIFMAVEKGPDQDVRMAGDTFLGTITFKGEMEGCLGICLGHDCAKSVSANMLCIDNPDDVSDEDLTDAIGEIANMVMGCVKTRLQDNMPNLEISIPAVISGRVLRSNLGDCTLKERLMVKIDQFDAELTFSGRVAAE